MRRRRRGTPGAKTQQPSTWKLTHNQPRHISVPRLGSYNKYTQIASRAVRTGLKESERVGAEKRANIGVKYQQWENGKGGEQVSGALLGFSFIGERV